MILAIDIGNTNIVFGLFKGKKLVKSWRFATYKYTLPQIKGLAQIVICSVVPKIDRSFKEKIKIKYGIEPFFVTAYNIPLNIKLKNKNEIGADRIVDAYAALELYGAPVIVVDFGTATTFDVISKNKDYLGGAITPGIMLARDALHERTAKLPKVEVKMPKLLIGNDTVSAMQSGLYYGYIALVEGMIAKLKAQSSKLKSANVIATGGLASLICKGTRVIDTIDMNLTLKGLYLIGVNNVRRIK